MGDSCIVMTPALRELYNKVLSKYPEECKRIGFNETVFLGWVEAYNNANNKPIDFIPEINALLNNVETDKNRDGQSFFHTPQKITYTPVGRSKQTYNIIGTKIFNKDNKEVFAEDSKDRRKIFANLAVQQGRAVVVEYKGKKYVVNNRNQIISVSTGDEMKWGEENGDRKEVLRLSQIAFREKQKAETTIDNLTVATEVESTINQEENRSSNTEGQQDNVEQILNDIINGKRQFNNLSEEENDVARGNRLLAAAEVASRLYGEANGEESQDARNERQERQVESWAKQAGVWHEDALIFGKSFGKELKGGQESHVYENLSSKTVVKVKATNQYHDLVEFLDGIILHNTLFPETAYKVLGFGNDGDGFVVILEQPFIVGEIPTKEQIDDFIKQVAPDSEKYEQELDNNRYKTPKILIHDVSPRNVILTPEGNLAVIDAIIRPNVASEGKDGTRSDDTGISEVNQALEEFKKDIDLLAGYYEGGGRVLKDDLPNITEELDDKLNNYFMGGEELSIDDYRNLWKLIEFYNDNGERRFRERKPSTSSSPSNATQNNLVASARTFGTEPTAEQQAAGIKAKEEANAPVKTVEFKEVRYEPSLSVNDSKVAKFNRTFSPQQIKDRGAMISSMFSNIIDEHLQDLIDEQRDIIENENSSESQKNSARETLHKLLDPINGRQFAAQDKQIRVILEEIKQTLQRDMEYASEDKKLLWQNTIDYFTELFNTQASLDIEEREGIRIVNLEIEEKTASEDDNDEQDDGDDEVGHVVSGSDGWSFQVRYTNPFDSLTKKVKGMFYEIERPESEKDDLGQQRYYPMGQIYASMLTYLSANVESADDFLKVYKEYNEIPEDRSSHMYADEETFNQRYPNGYPIFPALEDMKRIYPWVEQIIQKLTDDYMAADWNTNLRYPSTGGAMASQVYRIVQRFIPYAKIQLGDGKFDVTPLNYQMEDRVQYDKLMANYNNRMILTSHSIYNSDGTLNKEKAHWLSEKISELISILGNNDFEYIIKYPNAEDVTPEDIKAYNDFISSAQHVIQSFGIDATTDGVTTYFMMKAKGNTLKDMLSNLQYIANLVEKIPDEKLENMDYILDLRNPYKEPVWRHFFDGRGMITDASYIQSFYDAASHKTKYSYSADNYLMKKFRGVCMGTLEERRQYIDDNFGKYEWFKDQETQEWRNKWLEYWYNNPDEQKEIPYRNIDNVTDYEKETTTIRPYVKWTPDDIWQVQNRSYNEDSKKKTAFYLSPIFSDSPMSMTVKGPKMNMDELLYGYVDESGKRHSGAFVSLINQEMQRISYVQERAKAIKEGRVTPISNFDDGVGSLFCFIPELNSYVFSDTNESFLERMIRLKAEKAPASEIEASQIQAIRDIIGARREEYLQDNNKHNTDKPITEEAYYNMAYANAAIIQITTVDLAFYGKGQRDSTNDTLQQMFIDFQKRFKEVYAGGIQLNTNSKYGKKIENIIILSDDIITSPSYNDVARVIDNSKTLSQKDKDDIKATFTGINVADAQAIRSMHSFRSILDMMGNWTDEMETALQHFKEGTWDRADYDIIYQTIKPFVYSVIERNDGNGGSILVPQQNKNSEICALMMYDLITNGLNNSPVYKALSRFMEDTVGADGEQLIDMIQYESAGKVGNQGVINISFNPNKVISLIDNGADFIDAAFESAWDGNKYIPNTIENAERNYKAIKDKADSYLKEGKMSQEEYNKLIEYLRPTEDEIISMLEKATLITNPDGTKSINPEIVHTIPFENYYQQQPTPEHHIDAEATFGSQARNITVADLPEDFELTVPAKGRTHTFKGRDAIIDFYYELLNENLIEDFFGKGSKKGLKGLFASKKDLRDAVEEIVRGNPKYSKDFADALQLDSNNNFVLSPNSPTVFNMMQEIITSFFKNRITKQTINGASLIQAAGIGLDDNLRLVFEGNKLAGAECYMPLTSKQFFEPLLEEKTINGKKVKVLDPEKLKEAGLDKAIGYRIPTENKSSMMPLIIKGFTPLQNGSAIILPAEITNIAGSDFDVDKMFIMLLSFYIQTHDMKKARETWANQQKVIKELSEIFYNSDLLDEVSEADPQEFKEWFEEHKDEFELATPRIHKIEYDFNKSPKENGRKARNNMLIQMMFGILTSKEGSESVLNPQGFKDAKRAAKITKIATDERLFGLLPRYLESMGKFPTDSIDAEELSINWLLEASTKDLEKFINEYSNPESPIYPQTFAHSHARNMAGTNQIGIYAIQASMCAKYQRANVRLKEEQQFTINGRQINKIDISDNGKRLKGCGQMVGASADNGKDPNLTDMGSTSKTAPMIGYMLRAGLTHLEAALIINQPYMTDSGFNTKSSFWDDVFGKYVNPLKIDAGDITTEMLIKNIVSPDELSDEEQQAIASVCYRVLQQHEAQEYLTQISRADSPNGAIKNNYAKARIQRFKVDLFQAKMGQSNFPFVRINEAISNDAINTSASEDVVREQLKAQSMAFLHGMYALGIKSFNDLVSPYFFGAQEWFDDSIVKPILYNLKETIGDEKREEIVNNIYKSYVTFILSNSSLFGNEENRSMKSKRESYLQGFPNEFRKILNENEDIKDLIGSILQVIRDGNRQRIVLQNVGSIGKEQRQDIQRRFERLLSSSNRNARNLAKDLFIYSYYDNGLQFTHDSFSTMFTTQFIINFPVYTDTLNALETEILPEQRENFIKQFLITYPDVAYKVDGKITSDNVDGNIIRIKMSNNKLRKFITNEVMSPNPQSDGINPYPYISYNGDVYVLNQEAFDYDHSELEYYKLPKYTTYTKLPLFSSQMTVEELAEEFPVNEEQEERPTIPDSDSMPVNEGNGDPNIKSDSLYDTANSMDDFDADVDWSDVKASEPVNKTDKYKSEGEGELRDSLCQ